MGEHPDVWGGGGRPPRRQQELAALLSSGVFTLEAIARELEISQDDAGHILRRLKSRGFDIQLLYCGAEGEAPLYRVLYPKGRVCAAPGCGTLLRRSNPSDRCEVHGGGVLDLRAAPARVSRVDGAALRAAREGHGLTVRQLAGEVDLSPGFVSQLERGRRPVTPAIAQRLAKTLGTTVMRR